MKSPKKWIGYDENWNYVTTVYSKKATNYIDPDVVKARINSVNRVMNEQVELIQKSLNSTIEDANQAIIVNSIKLGPQIEELITSLDALKDTPNEALEYIYTYSVQAHDNWQSQLNDNAYYQTLNVENVEHVQ